MDNKIAIAVINDQFVKLNCTDAHFVTYTAYVRVGSISGIIDHNNKCIVITPEKEYRTTSTFEQLVETLNISVS